MRKPWSAAVAATLFIGLSCATATTAGAGADERDPANYDAIIGGSSAPTGKWPFQVALLVAGKGDNYESERCGGTLVDKFHVVTAAHCVDGFGASQLRVLTGTQSLADGGRRQRIARIKVHPNYNPANTDFDIAVITLARPAAGVRYFAELITPAQERNLARPGMMSIVIGWGSTIRRSGGYPEQLQQVLMPIVSRTECNSSGAYDGDITARMVCAGYPRIRKDSCDGDSGGPLIVKDADGQWRLQAGIVSWGAFPCAAPNRPGVYSRVAMLSSWAKTVIAGDAAFVAALDCERLKGQGQRLCAQARSRDE
jgi:secreted trypsin-like serine protease